MGFMGLVLALVCAWLICQFIRKFGKAFFTRFIPKFFKVFIPKFCKIMIWITLVISVLYIGFVIVDFTYHYTRDYVYDREFLVTGHMLPSDLMPQIREYGIRRTWRRWYWERSMPEERYKAMIKREEQEARDKRENKNKNKKRFLELSQKELNKFGHHPDPPNTGFWEHICNYLGSKYILYEWAKEERHF